MEKTIPSVFVLVLFSTGVVIGFIAPVASYLEKTNSLTEVALPVHNIHSGKDFPKIQEAINDNETLDGHTILVDAGTYAEHVVINKSLALIGEDKVTTIIDGTMNGTVINVTVSNVLIKDFTIRNSNVGWYYYGIRVEASRCNIIGNVVANCLWGVDLFSSPDSIIFGNNITNNTAPGVRVTASPNVSISENTITNNIGTAIWVNVSSSSIISRNNIADNSGEGVVLLKSANTVVSENRITNSGSGIEDGYGVYLSSNEVLVERNTITRNYCGLAISGGDNSVTDNTISGNFEGICLVGSSFLRNQIYNNNLIENENQVVLESSYPRSNVWDNGHPSGGNYWSDYNGTDVDQDGIGNTAYVLGVNNTDNYPLMGMFSDFEATSEYNVQTICNSTISDFLFEHFTPSEIRVISFDVRGEDGTTGFCRICIPKALMNEPYTVLVNATEVSYNLLPFSNETHSYLYFTYGHSTQEVIIMHAPGEDSRPPSIGVASQEPEVPDDGENVTVTVDVTDTESGVHNVTIFYSTNDGESWNNVTMQKTTGNTYQGQIPGLPAETHVQYKIAAYDNAENLAVEDNAGEYYVYTVIPEFPSFLLLPLFMITTLVVLTVYKRKKFA